MRHRKRGRKLGRNATHRKAMFRNMANSLFEHESIVTTVAKAKALRPFAEKCITVARGVVGAQAEAEKIRAKAAGLEKGSKERDQILAEWRIAVAPVLHARRQLIKRLGNHRLETRTDNDTVIQKLLNVIGPRYVDRPGGYTKILKLAKRRLGDAGPTALIALVPTDADTVIRKRKAAADE